MVFNWLKCYKSEKELVINTAQSLYGKLRQKSLMMMMMMIIIIIIIIIIIKLHYIYIMVFNWLQCHKSENL
jgi:hypothetical protein